MFNIRKRNNKVVIEKSTIPTSPAIGRQLANMALENMKLQSQLSELEEVKLPDVQSSNTMEQRVKEKVAATMAESNVRVAAMIQKEKDNAPAPKIKGSNQNVPDLQKACAGLGENITTF